MADGIIGSVGVTVTPDAERFWTTFAAQTRGGAEEAGRRDGATYTRAFETEATRAQPRLTPRVDTRDAEARLAALRTQFNQGVDFRVDTGNLSSGQLAQITSATHRLSDAQDALRTARADQAKTAQKAGVTEEELAAASQRVARAQRDESLAALRLAATQDSVAAAQRRAAEQADKATAAKTKMADSGNLPSLLGILIPLAPALVPIAGAAAAGGAALAAMGAEGVLAFKGIQSEMKAGTADGQRFAAGVSLIKGELAALETSAAHGVLPGFDSATGSIQKAFPQLNAGVQAQSAILGDAAAKAVGGVAAGLVQLQPVINEVDGTVDDLAGRFEKWASGPGGAKFASTLSTDFREAVPALESLATTGARLVGAFAPSGNSVVTYLGTFSSVINHIPVGVLTAGADALVIFKTAAAATAGLKAATVTLEGFAAAESAAGSAGVVSGLRGAAGGTAALLSRVAPFAAVAVGASLGLHELGQATDSWATSSNKAKVVAGGAFAVLSDLSHLDFGLSGTRAYNAAADDAEGLRVQARNAAAEVKQLAAATTDTLHNPSTEVASFAARYAAGVASAARSADTFTLSQATQTGKISGASDALNSLTTQLAKAIDHEQAYTKLTGDSQKIIDGTAYSTKAWALAMQDSGNDAQRAEDLLAGHTAALTADQAALSLAQTQQRRLTAAYAGAETALKITGDQTDLYASALGITAQQLAAGEISTRQFVAAISVAKRSIDDGSTSTQALVAAITQFNSGIDTAATRGQLIGAVLKAANGPALDYANTMVQGSSAAAQFGTDLKGATDGVLNLRTGTIDYHRAAAAPLLSDLASLQTAAVNSAAATYQLDTSQGRAGASAHAFSVYVAGTRGALEAQFTQMGYTKAQADKLATTYFGIKNSGDLKKQIGLLGGDKVNRTLSSILSDLDIIAGKTVLFTVDGTVTSNGQAALNAASRALGLGGSSTHVNSKSGGYGSIIKFATSATGTGPTGLPEGWGTVGEEGGNPHSWELIHKRGSHVEVFSNAESRAMTGWTRVPGFASGTSHSSSAKANPQIVTSSELSQIRGAISSLSASLSQGASAVRSAANSLISTANSAHKMTASQVRVLDHDRDKLSNAAKAYDSVQARLGTAPTAPTAYDRLATAQQAYSDTRSSTVSAITGSFNLATAGQPTSIFNDQAPGAVTASSIIAELNTDVANAKKFAAALQRLAKEGLPGGLLNELAQAGPSALPQALALEAATPAQLAQIKSQFSALNSAAGSAGKSVADDLNGAGVAAAQGLVNGLKSQEKNLKAEMSRLGNVLVGQIKKDLGIHSPSRVFHELGSFTAEGFHLGIQSKYDAIAKAGRGMAAAANPGLSLLEHRTPGTAAPGTTITVHPAPGMDEVALATAVARRQAFRAMA